MEVPGMEAFRKLVQSAAAAGATRLNGVRPDTLLLLEKVSGRM